MQPNVNKIHSILKSLYPDALCSLEYGGDPWRLLIAARLSAQCTDERVNIVCGPLFRKYPDAAAMAEADPAEAEEIIAMSKIIAEQYGGRVPDTMEELLALPGVGRKIANLILGDCFGTPGIVADTHCIRICGRLGFYPESLKDPLKVERILSEAMPKEEQAAWCHRMVLFGRAVCMARSPRCAECPVREECAHAEGPDRPTV